MFLIYCLLAFNSPFFKTCIFHNTGYGLERNTRFISEWGEGQEVYNNLIDGRELQGWTYRMTLQNVDNYDDAVSTLTDALYTSTEYTIISGVKKGIILAKSPNGVAHTQGTQ